MFGSSPAIRLTGLVVTEWLLEQQTLDKLNHNQEVEMWSLSCGSFKGKENSRPEIPVESINPPTGGAQPSVRSESRLNSGVQHRWVISALRKLRPAWVT